MAFHTLVTTIRYDTDFRYHNYNKWSSLVTKGYNKRLTGLYLSIIKLITENLLAGICNRKHK